MAGVRFLRELRRRHVFRVAAGHAVAGWLLIQVAAQAAPCFESPNGSLRLVVRIPTGFPVPPAPAPALEATPQGISRAHASPTFAPGRDPQRGDEGLEAFPKVRGPGQDAAHG